MLIQGLPPTARLWQAVDADHAAAEAEKPDAKVLTLKQRTEHWRRIGQQQAEQSATA